jgi:hypothetical protein
LLMAYLPYLSFSLYSILSRLRGSRLAPGRPSMVGLPFKMRERRGSGNPPAG